MPSLIGIDFIFNFEPGEMTQDEFDMLLSKILMIHNAVRSSEAERFKNETSRMSRRG